MAKDIRDVFDVVPVALWRTRYATLGQRALMNTTPPAASGACTGRRVIPPYEQTFTDWVRVRGCDRPETLTAGLLAEQGRVDADASWNRHDFDSTEVP